MGIMVGLPSPSGSEKDLQLNFGKNMTVQVEMRAPHLPAEWHLQSGIQLTWPHAGTDWAYMLKEVQECFVNIAKEIAKELGKELVIKDIAFDSIINEVRTGKADIGAAGISYSDERAKKVDFSINYSVSKQVVIVKNDSFINSINDINDKKIAVQLGSVADTYVTENYKNAEIVRQKKYLAAIEDLKVGKVDLVVMDELPAKEIIEKNSGIKILDGELTSDSYGMIVKKGNTELLEAVNKVLNRLSSDGSIDNFIIKHTEE